MMPRVSFGTNIDAPDTVTAAALHKALRARSDTDGPNIVGTAITGTDLSAPQPEQTNCTIAGGPPPRDDDEDEDVCRTCHGRGASSDDAYDGECPSCADKSDEALQAELSKGDTV